MDDHIESKIGVEKFQFRKKLSIFYAILDLLISNGEMNMSAIGKSISGNNYNITNHIRELEEKKLVSIIPSKMNSKVIKITESGIEFWKMYKIIDQVYEKLERMFE